MSDQPMPPSQIPPGAPGPSAPGGGGERLCVVLAICDSALRAAARALLARTNLNLEVEEADCLTGVLQLLQRFPCDCVLAEFHQRSGEETTLDLLAAMRREQLTAPVVVLTGSHPVESAVEAMKAGAVDYLIRDRVTPYALAQSILRAVQLARESRREGESAARLGAERREALLARDAALEAGRIKSQFLAFTTHELKTPLNAILGYAEMLQEELAGSGQPDLAADALRIRDAAGHLALLISDLLDLSGLEAGKFQLQYADVDIAPLVAEAVELTAELSRRNRNTVAVDLAPHAGPVRTDPMRLRQILINLLSNAAKFTTGGRITVTVRYPARAGRPWLELSVADTGPGIPPDRLADLFEPYRQITTDPAQRQAGTGLGLTLTRLLCWAMQGDITVHSRPGRGAAFTVTLPVDADGLSCSGRADAF